MHVSPMNMERVLNRLAQFGVIQCPRCETSSFGFCNNGRFLDNVAKPPTYVSSQIRNSQYARIRTQRMNLLLLTIEVLKKNRASSLVRRGLSPSQILLIRHMTWWISKVNMTAWSQGVRFQGPGNWCAGWPVQNAVSRLDFAGEKKGYILNGPKKDERSSIIYW